MFSRKNALPLAAALAVVLLAFLKLGQHPLSPWDEARTGVNALEMLHNGDWVNLHYLGQPDNWRAKPPLVVWCVAASFRAFGPGELALRLPSALAICGAFFFIFKIITLYRSPQFAAWTCLLLASVNGLIGWHVGRTGDFDALLTCLLLAGLFCFLRAFDFGKKPGVPLAGLLWGLAFLAKGPAMVVLLPGAALYAALTGRLRALVFSKSTWAAAALCLAFPLGWWLALHFFGKKLPDASAGDNAFERLFLYDLVKRFTQPGGGWKEPFDFSFLFYSLDKSFNLWHYAFFGFLLYGGLRFFQNKRVFIDRVTASHPVNKSHRLLLLSLCLWLPLALFLSVAAKSNRWYLAPALPFAGIATMWGVRHFWKKAGWVKWAFFALLAFTLGRRFAEVLTPKAKPAIIAAHCAGIAGAKGAFVFGAVEQDLLLYLYFCRRSEGVRSPSDQPVFAKRPENLAAGEVLFVSKSNWKGGQAGRWEVVGESEKHWLLRVK